MSDNAMFAALDAFNTNPKPAHQQQQQLLQHQGLASDFFSFQSPETFAPPADLFESDLDLISQDFDADALQLQLLTVDSHDAFSYIRSDTPTCGPPSTITVSSESAYDSYSTRSESYYNYPNSPFSNYSFPIGLEMDFQRIRVESASEYGVPQVGLDPADPTSFGALPPTPPRSPAAKHDMRSSISDYGPPRRNTGSNEYFNFSAAAVAPSTMHQRQPLSGLPTIPSLGEPAEDKEGGRKKYRCESCPRSFARAYNLKTHRATHDPNRPKPHVCPHRACGRSFSRKHDLGRHLVSIHREESCASSHHSASSKRSIGVDGVARVWCDSCGRGAVGRTLDCDCHDVK